MYILTVTTTAKHQNHLSKAGKGKHELKAALKATLKRTKHMRKNETRHN
jgi:hypothetical protein